MSDANCDANERRYVQLLLTSEGARQALRQLRQLNEVQGPQRGPGVAVVVYRQALVPSSAAAIAVSIAEEPPHMLLQDLGSVAQKLVPSCVDAPGGLERAHALLRRACRPGATVAVVLLTATDLRWERADGTRSDKPEPQTRLLWGVRPQEARVRVYEVDAATAALLPV